MRRGGRRWIDVIAAVALAHGTGCVYTTAGNKLPPITPPSAAFQPTVEDTVGDYSFTLEGGGMVSANYAGTLVNRQIMDSWKERGYIRRVEAVDTGAFTNAADYNVTLSGTQYGESSILLQIVSGLTLTILPYTVTQNYDIQYTVKDLKSGHTYSASVQDSNEAYVELFLLFLFPLGKRGQEQLMATMGDHLYAQLREQGAFQPPAAAPVASLPPIDATPTADVPSAP